MPVPASVSLCPSVCLSPSVSAPLSLTVLSLLPCPLALTALLSPQGLSPTSLSRGPWGASVSVCVCPLSPAAPPSSFPQAHFSLDGFLCLCVCVPVTHTRPESPQRRSTGTALPSSRGPANRGLRPPGAAPWLPHLRAASLLQEQLRADTERRECRLAITQLISAQPADESAIPALLQAHLRARISFLINYLQQPGAGGEERVSSGARTLPPPILSR